MLLSFLGIPDYYWHPLQNGNGYNFWSGFGSDIGEVSIVGGLVTIVWQSYRHHNCHVQGCYRLGHIDPHNHHPACKVHHSHRDKIGEDPHHHG